MSEIPITSQFNDFLLRHSQWARNKYKTEENIKTNDLMNRMVKEKKSFQWLMTEAASEIVGKTYTTNCKRKYDDDTEDEQVITSSTISDD